jgi:anti-sigma factor RsiW
MNTESGECEFVNAQRRLAYLLGDLDAVSAARLEAEVTRCPRCASLLQEDAKEVAWLQSCGEALAPMPSERALERVCNEVPVWRDDGHDYRHSRGAPQAGASRRRFSLGSGSFAAFASAAIALVMVRAQMPARLIAANSESSGAAHSRSKIDPVSSRAHAETTEVAIASEASSAASNPLLWCERQASNEDLPPGNGSSACSLEVEALSSVAASAERAGSEEICVERDNGLMCSVADLNVANL